MCTSFHIRYSPLSRIKYNQFTLVRRNYNKKLTDMLIQLESCSRVKVMIKFALLNFQNQTILRILMFGYSFAKPLLNLTGVNIQYLCMVLNKCLSINSVRGSFLIWPPKYNRRTIYTLSLRIIRTVVIMIVYTQCQNETMCEFNFSI